MSERTAYIRHVFETTLYLRDMYEEYGGGHTGLIQLLKPIKSVSNTAVRGFVLHELFEKKLLTLYEAAQRFAIWTPTGENTAPYQLSEIQSELIELCSEYERPICMVNDEGTIEKRSYLRAARYISLISKKQVPAHSRVFELFIPDKFVPTGTGMEGLEHREHVVPCLYLLEMCKNRFDSGASIENVADLISRYLVIVKISKQQQKHLDASKKNGGLGLKNTMPEGWLPERDCIFQRLHDAAINFSPPKGFNSEGVQNFV